MTMLRRVPAVLLPLLLLSGCAGAPERKQEADQGYSRLERRIQVLERKLARLERQQSMEVRLYPARPDARDASPGELEQVLENLQQERLRLIRRYTPCHPDVQMLDREIRRLQEQREREPTPLRETPMDISQP